LVIIKAAMLSLNIAAFSYHLQRKDFSTRNIMEQESAFEIELQDYFIKALLQEDTEAMQRLYEKCQDFNLLVEGIPFGEDTAQMTFQDLPPGKLLEDKFLWGIYSTAQELVGLLDVVRGYPNEATWWIGLLLLAPEVRARHIGGKAVKGFIDFVKKNGGCAVMLGVVEENKNAYCFWEKMGFEFVRQTEPRAFGKKTQRVNVMRLTLQDQ
jgi:GNAT superfamily N-acetyltransferase